MKYHKGRYIPHNKQKYIGDITNIIYRSSWERRFMKYCDTNSSIIEWSSEELYVPYVSPIDNKYHRYYPDFIIKVKSKKPPHFNIAVGVIWRGNDILITKRKLGGLLGGLWEFPGGKIEEGETPEECMELAEWCSDKGLFERYGDAGWAASGKQ